jgi:O-antigen/teichoic acid export membrane protein
MNGIKRLWGDRFIRNNLVFFFGSMAVAFLNYLYYPVLGRAMKVADFGELQAFISLTLIVGAFAGIFQNVIVNTVANAHDEEGKEAVAALKRAGLFFSLMAAMFIVVFGKTLAVFFNLRESYLYLALALSTVLGISLVANQAVIQGVRDFKALSASNIISSAGRLLFSFVFVWIGLSLLGAVGGIILAQAAALAYAFWRIRDDSDFGRRREIKRGARALRELPYAFLVFAASFSVTFMYSGDVIVVKKLFSPETAGLYGGIATIGRIIFFVSGPIAAVLFSSVTIKGRSGENARVLAKAGLLTALAGAGVFLTFLLFPDNIVAILIGRRYAEYAHLLPLAGLFLLFVSFSNLLFLYLLALRDRFVFYAAAVGPLVTVFLCIANRGSVAAIVADFLVGSVAALVLLLVRTLIDLKTRRHYESVNIASDTFVQ